jgi:hypothetical protein
MDRVFESGASGTPPSEPASPSTGYPTAGNPSLAIPATKPGPWWYHMITEELRAVVSGAGLTPDHTDITQLLAAIGRFCVGFGQSEYADVTASRSIGTEYTNNTGRPIHVSIYAGTGAGNGVDGSGLSLKVAGADVAAIFGPVTNGVAISGQLSAIVPRGATYQTAQAGLGLATIAYWREL